MEMPVTGELLSSWSKAYQASPERKLATMALSKSPMDKVAWVGAPDMRCRFSVDVETMKVTDQKSSGRCWLFAATNVIRERIAKERNIESFELSQSWLAFWDKFERCNYFLETMLATADLPANDRTVMFVLQTGIHDGGQWDMCANIIRKYGIVPKDAYDETAQTGATRTLNYILNRAMKSAAIRLRNMKNAGASDDELQMAKNEVLGKAYGYLSSCYGEPPATFDFEYVDKDKVYHIERELTPIAFRDEFLGNLLDETVSCINAPTEDKPFHRTFTIRLLNNVIGGKPVCHLNLTMEEMKASIIRQLQDGKVVWFGSDVGHFGERELGIWDDACFDYELLSGMQLDISKADALDYSFSAMNHAMVLTGVNLDAAGKPTRWKIENSWGEEHGTKGYYICSDTWFDQYVYQAAIERKYLGELAELTAQEPIELEPWDPMGTLAD